jgi:hypothetical protein
MKDKKGRRYTFMETHDGEEEKSKTNYYRDEFKKRSEGRF